MTNGNVGWLKDTFDEVYPWRVTLAPDSSPGWAKYATVIGSRWAPSVRGNPEKTKGVLAFNSQDDADRIADLFNGKAESLHTAEHPELLWLRSLADDEKLELPPALTENKTTKTELMAKLANQREKDVLSSLRNHNRSAAMSQQKWNIDVRQSIVDRLRRAGWTYDEVAVECEYASAASARDCHQRYRKQQFEAGRRVDLDYKYKHLTVLEGLADKLQDKIEKNDYSVDDVYVLLKIMEREAKLTGIETLKIEHSLAKPDEMTVEQIQQRLETLRRERQQLAITVQGVDKSGK